MADGSLGFDAVPHNPSVSAAESSPELGRMSGFGGGAGEPIVDLSYLEPSTGVPADAGVAGGLDVAAAWQVFAKRAIDVTGSFVLLVFVFPILLIACIAIVLTSRGPALYVSERIGKDGQPFQMLKLRSMRARAAEERDDVVHLNSATGPIFKIPDDPRVTPVGRVLRRLSIDELPQLANVLIGDMSLVGPRPPLPQEYATYDEHQCERLAVTPGITCIWQVSGRSDIDFETWVEMDLEYIETWNLRKDLKILLLTVPAVLSGRGAY